MMFFAFFGLALLMLGSLNHIEHLLMMRHNSISQGSPEERDFLKGKRDVEKYSSWLFQLCVVGFLGSAIYFFVG